MTNSSGRHDDCLSDRLPRGGFVETQIRRITRNHLVIIVVLFLVLLIATIVVAPSLALGLRGPRPVTDEELLKMAKDPSTDLVLENVTLPEKELAEGPLVTKKDAKVRYYLASIGEQQLFVRTIEDAPPQTVSGPIYRWSYAYTTDREARDRYLRNNPGHEDRVLPFVLDATGNFREYCLIFVELGIVFYLICAGFFVRAGLVWSDPNRHSLPRKLADFGEPLTVAEDLERDLAKGPVVSLTKATLTPHWFLQPTAFSATMVSLPAVVWFYANVRQHMCQVVFNLGNGKSVRATLEAQDYRVLVRELANRYPYVISGWSQLDFDLWRDDWPRLVEKVHARRESLDAAEIVEFPDEPRS